MLTAKGFLNWMPKRWNDALFQGVHPLRELWTAYGKKADPRSARRETLVWDFGSSRMLLLQAEPRGAGWGIRDFVVLPWDPLKSKEDMKSLLKGSLARLDLRSGPRIVVTWEEGMVFRQALLPALSEAESKKALLWEMRNKHGVDADDALLDFACAFEEEKTDKKKERLYSVFYTEKKKAMENLDWFGPFGFLPEALIPGEAALASFTASLPVDVEKDFLVCDIGYTGMRVLVVRNKKNLLSRTVALGGRHLTEMMMAPFPGGGKKAPCSFEEAEELKIKEGAKDPKASHIVLLRPYLDKVVAEIKRSIEFYGRQKFSRPVSGVVLTGGGSSLKGLREFVIQFLGLPVVAVEPEGYFTDSLSAEKKETVAGRFGSFCAALGAAMASEGPDLLPPEIRYEKQERLRRMALRMAVLALGALLAFWSLGAWVKTRFAAGHLAAVQAEWNEMSRVYALLEKVIQQESLRRLAFKGDMAHEALLKELSRLVPEAVVLREIGFNRMEEAVVLKGFVHASKGAEVKVIAQFMQQLIASPFFRDAVLVRTSYEDSAAGRSEFEVRCLVEGVG